MVLGRVLLFSHAAVVRAATGTTLPIVSGLVVAMLTFSGAVWWWRSSALEKMFILGDVIWPSACDNAGRRPVSERRCHAVRNSRRRHRLRHGLFRNASERAAVCPTRRTRWPAVRLFRVGYLSFNLPALAAGFLAPIVGLTRTADFYGIGVILLAITSLAITLLRGRRA